MEEVGGQGQKKGVENEKGVVMVEEEVEGRGEKRIDVGMVHGEGIAEEVGGRGQKKGVENEKRVIMVEEEGEKRIVEGVVHGEGIVEETKKGR